MADKNDVLINASSASIAYVLLQTARLITQVS